MKVWTCAALAMLLSGCGLASQPAALSPHQSSSTTTLSWTPLRDIDTRYLTIANSQVNRAKVMALAGYSGLLPEDVVAEFARRYGYRDYIVIETLHTDGTFRGRVYGWQDDSSGVNAPLMEAPIGSQATVVNESGHITYQGKLKLRHDFLKFAVSKTLKSPDGLWMAEIGAAGYEGDNYLIARNKLGAVYNWQAGGRSGDLYLDAQWLPGGILLTYEGTPEDQLVFQEHNAEHYISEVLSPELVKADAQAAGMTLDPETDPLCSHLQHREDQLSYVTTLKLEDGRTVQKKWQGTYQIDEKGLVKLINRHILP